MRAGDRERHVMMAEDRERTCHEAGDRERHVMMAGDRERTCHDGW